MAQTMALSSCIFAATTTHNKISPSLFKPSPFVAGHKLGPLPLTTSRPKSSVVTRVIPFDKDYVGPLPPDLPSYFLSNRIVYLGNTLSPATTEMIVSQLLYLQMEDEKKPIYLYINSTGTIKGGEKYGYEAQAVAIYNVMSDFIKPPIFTLCVGNAWGEAALLLAAGAKGNRAALPSSTIMIREPIDRVRGQATQIEITRKEVTRIKAVMVELLSKRTGKPPEEIEADIRRPKYFSPSEAVEYGIIDKVIYNEKSPRGRGVYADLKEA